MKTKEVKQIVLKAVKRIKESNTFTIKNRYGMTQYLFDQGFTVSRYNGLYRIEYNGQELAHIHPKDRNGVFLESKGSNWVMIFQAIYNRKEQQKKIALDKF